MYIEFIHTRRADCTNLFPTIPLNAAFYMGFDKCDVNERIETVHELEDERFDDQRILVFALSFVVFPFVQDNSQIHVDLIENKNATSID